MKPKAKKIIKISQSKYLQALGLFTLAADHYKKAREFEIAMGELIGHPDKDGYFGHLSDAVFMRESFDKALAKEGFVVIPAKKRKRV